MKITTVSFKFNISEILNKVVKNITFFLFSFVAIIVSVVILSNLKIDNFMIMNITNIRESVNYNINIADIRHVYPFFNETNYTIKEKEVAKIEIKETDYDKLDDIRDVDVIKKKYDIDINSTKTLDRVTIGNIKLLNYSSFKDINYQSLIDRVITLTKKSDNIFLYNTHTSESYTNSEKYKFEYKGNFRSYDANYNMISVASKLNENLKEKGFSIIQETTSHDYGTYTSAYARSKLTIQNAIKTYGNFGMSIDIHRDANNTTTFRPVVEINGVQVAQCMLVMGVGTNKNRNGYYEENLALAIQLQLLADKIYPGLFRPMYIRDSLYNQDMNRNSLLIEFGATGNTFDEVYNTTRCISNLLDKLYKN